MQTVTATTESIPDGLAAANARFMERFNAGDVAGAARGVYTSDARVLPPGAPTVRGRDDIISFWTGAAAALGITEVRLSTVELEAQGETMYEIGRADLRVAGGEQQVVSKYVVIWKQEDGEWRWHVDIWNMDG